MTFMKKRTIILGTLWGFGLLVAGLAAALQTRAEESTPPADAAADERTPLDELTERLSAPMEEDGYAGRVERMGRCPDRFDYLYEAAFARCYAVRQTDKVKKKAIEEKAGKYYEVWRSREESSKRADFYVRYADLAAGMEENLRTILRHDPDHPYKKDLISAIDQLEAAHPLRARLSCASARVPAGSSPTFTWEIENVGKQKIVLANHFASLSLGPLLVLEFTPSGKTGTTVTVGLDPEDTVNFGTQERKVRTLEQDGKVRVVAKARLTPFSGPNQGKPLPPGTYRVRAVYDCRRIPEHWLGALKKEGIERKEVWTGKLPSNDIPLSIEGEPEVSEGVRKTILGECRRRWGFDEKRLSGVTIHADRDEFLARFEDDKFAYTMRCDRNGKWINDGRREK